MMQKHSNIKKIAKHNKLSFKVHFSLVTFLQPRIKLKEWEKDREGELTHLTQV